MLREALEQVGRREESPVAGDEDDEYGVEAGPSVGRGWKERMREAAKRPQYARRAERRVTDAAADEQRLQAQPAQADARHDAHHIPFLLLFVP